MVSKKNKHKKVHLEYLFLDTEIPVIPQDIRRHLEKTQEYL